MIQSNKEKKNKQMGAIISVGAHVVAILLFLFVVAWRAPDPPMPEIGIELNFGLEDAGSGDIQPEPNTQPAESESEEEAAPDGLEETPEEVVEEATEVLDEPIETDETPTEEVVTPVTNTQDSPDVVEDKPEEPLVKEEPKKEEKPKTPAVLYPNNKTGSGGKDGSSNEAQNANQGDQPNANGDQGDTEGTVDSKYLYGTSGGGGGSSLHLSGWELDYKPDPDYPKSLNQTGEIVFQITVNDKGEVEKIKTLKTTVSPSLEKIYRDEVWKMTLSKTAGTGVATTSTGTITFVLKEK